jgi:hypothetical protein
MLDGSTPALLRIDTRAVWALLTAAALTAVVGPKAAANLAGSCPLSWASSSSVSGVICAVVVPLAEPEPGTTECRTVLLSLLVAVSTQGRVLPLSVTE